VYLETTIFNYYFDVERDAHADTVRLFEEIKAGKYQVFTSIYAVNEIMQAPEEKRDKMTALIEEYTITVLESREEVVQLAQIYLQQGVIPSSSIVDLLHIATAAVYDLDMIISLNFRHIVRKKTVELTALINSSQNYGKVDIYSPMEVVDREEP
jgi:predicted nucleic acid-binding protein